MAGGALSGLHLWRRLPIGARILALFVSGGGPVAVWGLKSGNWWTPLACLALIVGALSTYYGLKVWLTQIERRKSKGFAARLAERMFRPQPKLPDETVEEESLRKQFERRWQDVYETLRERGYDYYSFPWYLVIGASQSGKTTSIQKSNQEFPIGDKPVIDYGGTKNCNWFFTNKAILIDTAGRYVDALTDEAPAKGSMAEKSQQEWASFLDLLREMKPRSPINGLLLFIKVEDVIERDPKKRAKTVETLRRALQDIEYRLQVRVPVYVMVTMCDRLVGFVDFFSHLRGIAERTLFGWSRPGAFDSPWSAEVFRKGLVALSERVDSLGLQFLEEEANRGDTTPGGVAKRDRVLAFPEEFRALVQPLDDILSKVLAESAYNEQHFIRGVYFTSGLQEGIPALNACRDLVGDQALRIKEEDVKALTPESKAYFVADFYEQRVFKEQGLVRLTTREKQRRRKERMVAYVAAGVLVLGAGIWAVQAALVNLGLDLTQPFLTATQGKDIALFKDAWQRLVEAQSRGVLIGEAARDTWADGGEAFEKLIALQVLKPHLETVATGHVWKDAWDAQRFGGALADLLAIDRSRLPPITRGANEVQARDVPVFSLVSDLGAVPGACEAARQLDDLGSHAEGKWLDTVLAKEKNRLAQACTLWTKPKQAGLPEAGVDDAGYPLWVVLELLRGAASLKTIIDAWKNDLRSTASNEMRLADFRDKWAPTLKLRIDLEASLSGIRSLMSHADHEQAVKLAGQLDAHLKALHVSAGYTDLVSDQQQFGDLIKLEGKAIALQVERVQAMQCLLSTIDDLSLRDVVFCLPPLSQAANEQAPTLNAWVGVDCAEILNVIEKDRRDRFLSTCPSAWCEALPADASLQRFGREGVAEFAKRWAEWSRLARKVSDPGEKGWSPEARLAAERLQGLLQSYVRGFSDYWSMEVFGLGEGLQKASVVPPKTGPQLEWWAVNGDMVGTRLDLLAKLAEEWMLAGKAVRPSAGLGEINSEKLESELLDQATSQFIYAVGRVNVDDGRRKRFVAFGKAAAEIGHVSGKEKGKARLLAAAQRWEALRVQSTSGGDVFDGAWKDAASRIGAELSIEADGIFNQMWEEWLATNKSRSKFPFASGDACTREELDAAFGAAAFREEMLPLFLIPAAGMEWPFALQRTDAVDQFWRIAWIASWLSGGKGKGPEIAKVAVRGGNNDKFPRYLNVSIGTESRDLRLPQHEPYDLLSLLQMSMTEKGDLSVTCRDGDRKNWESCYHASDFAPPWEKVLRFLLEGENAEIHLSVRSLKETLRVEADPKLPMGLPNLKGFN